MADMFSALFSVFSGQKRGREEQAPPSPPTDAAPQSPEFTSYDLPKSVSKGFASYYKGYRAWQESPAQAPCSGGGRYGSPAASKGARTKPLDRAPRARLAQPATARPVKATARPVKAAVHHAAGYIPLRLGAPASKDSSWQAQCTSLLPPEEDWGDFRGAPAVNTATYRVTQPHPPAMAIGVRASQLTQLHGHRLLPRREPLPVQASAADSAWGDGNVSKGSVSERGAIPESASVGRRRAPSPALAPATAAASAVAPLVRPVARRIATPPVRLALPALGRDQLPPTITTPLLLVAEKSEDELAAAVAAASSVLAAIGPLAPSRPFLARASTPPLLPSQVDPVTDPNRISVTTFPAGLPAATPLTAVDGNAAPEVTPLTAADGKAAPEAPAPSQGGDIAKSFGEASRGAARSEAAMLSDDEDQGEEAPRGADSSSSSSSDDEVEGSGDADCEEGGDEDDEVTADEAVGDDDGEEDEWEELDDASMHDGAAPPPAAASQRLPTAAKPKSTPAVIELLDSSSEDDEKAPIPEAGPPAWANPSDPRSSYLFHPRLDAQTLHDAESVLLPRARGSRTGRPWGGWREGKVIALPEPGIYCTAGGAQCLWDGEWLNDEVINTLLRIENISLARRAAAAAASVAPTDASQAAASDGGAMGDSEPSSGGAAAAGSSAQAPLLHATGAPNGAPRRVFIWDSLFLARMLQGGRSGMDVYDYNLVKAWATGRGLNVLDVDWIIVPLHLSSHWALAVLDLKSKEVHYYDSLAAGAGNKSVERIEHLLHWLSDESAARGGEAARLDTADWKVIMYEDDQVPQQTNGIDCGVFMVSFALAIARGEVFRFSQADIPAIRRRFAADLATCNARMAAAKAAVSN